MSDDLLTRIPNPPELQPIPSIYSKVWQVVSVLFMVVGFALLGMGGWFFYQQQLEASKPPPARILEVSIDDLTATPAAQPSPTTAKPTARLKAVSDTPVVEPSAVPDTPVALPGPNATIPPISEAATKAAPSPVPDTPTAPPPPTATPTPTESVAESVPSLADNPLLVVEEEEAASVEAEPVAVETEEASVGTVATGLPPNRIVAESIDLDTDVIEVGWEMVVRNGAPTNVWVVADYAAGWHRNSMLPDQGGNIVFSGHHNIKGEVFRYIVDLEPGDIIKLYDETQVYEYAVEDKFIVKDKGEPEAIRRENAKWIGPFNDERLTMVTCWPYNNNTHRVVVISKPVGEAQAIGQ